MYHCFWAWLLFGCVMAAETAPAIVDREVAVMKILRQQVFPAEIQFQGGGYQDLDGNSIGEFAFLAQLAGRAGTNKIDLGDRTDTGIHLLVTPLAEGLTACGYTFSAILPAGQQGLLVERESLPTVGQPGVIDRQRFFAVLAWPATSNDGALAVLLMNDGNLFTCETKGRAPDATQVVTYDAKAGTWLTTWRRADPQGVLEQARTSLSLANVADAYRQADWLWRHATTIDPSLLGVRGSGVRDLYAEVASQHPPAMEAYRELMNDALARALADTSDPANVKGAALPVNHLAFLDYVFLAERVETSQQIVANFKRLDSVNHKLAVWEFETVARYLVREGEFQYMSTFIPPFVPAAEQMFKYALVQDYAMVRGGVMKPEYLMPAFLEKLALYRLVYQRNHRTTDVLLLDSFSSVNLTAEESTGLVKRAEELAARETPSKF